MQDIKKEVLKRTRIVYFIFFLIAFAIVGKIIHIQYVEGDRWKEKSENETVRRIAIEPTRGSIYSMNGNVLATSRPVFDICVDVTTIKKELFDNEVDSLAWYLSDLFPQKTKNEYKNILFAARRDTIKYKKLLKKISYLDVKKVKKFPIFKYGQYRGGLIIEKKEIRENPYKSLARRTLGYAREDASVGLEGAYDEMLTGTKGYKLQQRTGQSRWVDFSEDNLLDPEPGKNIFTTIDVNYQDVAETALRNQMTKFKAAEGCAVLMEVKTGRIKAIANLASDTSNGQFRLVENYNMAIGQSAEPGSTFKPISLMIALEDNKISIIDTVDVRNGTRTYFGKTVEDDHYYHRYLSVKRALEVSSNVGFSSIIYDNYPKQSDFVEHLYKIGMNQPLGIEIAGEGKPVIWHPKDKMWSKISLPWMAHGYSLQLTPLQLLAYYNAIANNGVLLKPQFVHRIEYFGKDYKVFEPEVLNERICSPSTVKQLNEALVGVVENGTAKRLSNSVYKIAGKTGTAHISINGSYSTRYYKASFVGYFPADNPMYSCIVVVNKPDKSIGHFGGQVAAPVFKEIADKVYAQELIVHNSETVETEKHAIPSVKTGYQNEIEKACKQLNIKFKSSNRSADYVIITNEGIDEINAATRSVRKSYVPNVIGMGLKDAMFLLESQGLKVTVTGKGKVVKQSLSANTKIKESRTIKIILE